MDFSCWTFFPILINVFIYLILIIISSLKFELVNSYTNFTTPLAEPRSLRLIGGENAKVKDFPYIAFLHRKYQYKLRGENHWVHFQCACTILSQTYVLTAAHCLHRCDSCGDTECPECEFFDLRSYTLYAGHVKPSHGGFKTGIKRAFIRPEYDRRCVLEFDIAILEVKKLLPFGPKISSVRLPDPVKLGKPISPAVVNTTCTSVGWGSTIKNHTNVDIGKRRLKTLRMTYIPVRECSLMFRYFCRSSSVCAKPSSELECNEDGGVPLVCDGIQIGVHSFTGSYCETPSVFVRVDVHLEWIKKIMDSSGT